MAEHPISPPLVSQLVAALRLLERHCRANAINAPTELASFVNTTFAVRGGPQWPTRDVLAPVVDPAGVPLLLTYEAAAEALSLSERTVRRLAAEGALPVVTVGASKRIARAALVEWVEAQQGARP